jgi:FixJ family two-component response regulator
MKDLPPTVFVVDDDDAVRNSLRLLLKSAGIAARL